MSTSQPFTRHDVTFTSGEDTCAAWLYVPTGVTSPPVVILGHGLGATREMRLDAFAERFAQAGIAALAFTYRHFGDSGGQPRQLLSIKRQLADWDAAIAWAKNRRDVDGKRIAVWGSSFGGGHAITVASRHPELKAAVAQCPFTDGLASALALGPTESLKVLPTVARDYASMVFRRPPAMIPLAGPPGSLALMNARMRCPATRRCCHPKRPSATRSRHGLPRPSPPTGRDVRSRRSSSQSCSASATLTVSRHQPKPYGTPALHPAVRSNVTTPAISTSTSESPLKHWSATRSSF
jgi:dienelactone hydrolase